MKALTIILVIVVIGIAAVMVSLYYFKTDKPIITTFQECAEAGNPVAESFPEQCRTKEGDLFVNWRGAGQFCTQVITPARNSETGEVREFPTPCDVPEGWNKL